MCPYYNKGCFVELMSRARSIEAQVVAYGQYGHDQKVHDPGATSTVAGIHNP